MSELKMSGFSTKLEYFSSKTVLTNVQKLLFCPDTRHTVFAFFSVCVCTIFQTFTVHIKDGHFRYKKIFALYLNGLA